MPNNVWITEKMGQLSLYMWLIFWNWQLAYWCLEDKQLFSSFWVICTILTLLCCCSLPAHICSWLGELILWLNCPESQISHFVSGPLTPRKTEMASVECWLTALKRLGPYCDLHIIYRVIVWLKETIRTTSCLVALSDRLAASFSSVTSASDTALAQNTLNLLSKPLNLLFGHCFLLIRFIIALCLTWASCSLENLILTFSFFFF